MQQDFYEYETVAASVTDQVLGETTAKGGRLHRLLCNVTTSATSNVILSDGSDTITIMPNARALGTYLIELNIATAKGPFKITTSAGVSVLAIGKWY
ncbi:MAG TPA: hypothetical protein VJ180_04745 [Pyrinomonadaceae bacterium]|nr:hypothetical protein [Pyrinomonadaceae bacterium]